MPSKKLTLPDQGIETLIRHIRGQKVILDSDLARVYGVSTKRFNEQFRRNRSRFPDDFAFRLTAEEAVNLWSQNATSSRFPMSSFLILPSNFLGSPFRSPHSTFAIRKSAFSSSSSTAKSLIRQFAK